MSSSVRPGSQPALRLLNRERVVNTLRSAGILSQADLAKITGLSPATVHNIVRALARSGVVSVEPLDGRRNSVRLASRSGFVIAADFGHRHLTVALADQTHRIVSQLRRSFDTPVGADEGLHLASQLIDGVISRSEITRQQVIGSAIGLPAPIDHQSGEVGSLSILSGWVGVNVRERAAAAFNLSGPCVVDNDANLGAFAEYIWGGGIGASNMAYLKLSEGVGAGLIIDDRLYSGPQGTAGEIGHVTVDEFGEICRCGNRGCLETIVSARHVLTELAPSHGDGLTIGKVVHLARSGDRACSRILTDVGTRVGHVVAGLCSLLNPEVVIVGGELAQASDLIITSMKRVVDRCGVPAATVGLRVRTAALGARSHLMGAIGVALRATAEPSI